MKTPSFIDNTRNMDFSPLPIFTGKSSSIPSLIFQKSQSTLNKVVRSSHYELPHQCYMKNLWPSLVFKKNSLDKLRTLLSWRRDKQYYWNFLYFHIPMEQKNMRVFKLVQSYLRFLEVDPFMYFLGFRIYEIYQKLSKNGLLLFIPNNWFLHNLKCFLY